MNTPPEIDGQPLELLIKFMGMTTGDSDNITLVAIKKANSHLAKLGTTWEALLRGKVKIIADPFASMNIPASAMNPNRNEDFRPKTPPPPKRPQSTPTPTPPPKPTRAPSSPVRPKRGNPAFVNDIKERTIVNKFEGTCTKCKNRVLAGDGLAHQWKRADGSTYWTSEHNTTCPPPRRFRPATTTEDFQL